MFRALVQALRSRHWPVVTFDPNASREQYLNLEKGKNVAINGHDVEIDTVTAAGIRVTVVYQWHEIHTLHVN